MTATMPLAVHLPSSLADHGPDAAAPAGGAQPVSAWTKSSSKRGLLGYLERSSYGVFKKALEGTGLDQKVPQELPSIVVIGEESSGKSATLERYSDVFFSSFHNGRPSAYRQCRTRLT